MELMSTREAADRWGISQRRVVVLCTEGRIEGAQMVGSQWVLPAFAKKPGDARVTHEKGRTYGRDAKPFLKWAGDRTRILPEIRKCYPFSEHVTKYAEPFVGSGAVLFDVLNKYEHLGEVFIGDANPELINAYRVVRDDAESLIETLHVMESEFLPLDNIDRKDYYMDKRRRFNRLKESDGGRIDTEKAALMVFLNHTCVNGTYRLNRKGEFNMPMGPYYRPQICNEVNLRAAHEKLAGATIICGDYEKAADFIDESTFVYLDPPEEGFDHDELAWFAQVVASRGAMVMLTVSDPGFYGGNHELVCYGRYAGNTAILTNFTRA